jgi:hypothetical protein
MQAYAAPDLDSQLAAIKMLAASWKRRIATTALIIINIVRKLAETSA